MRIAIVAAILALAVAPSVPLVAGVATQSARSELWSRSFLLAIGNSLLLAAGVSAVSLLIGLPTGLLGALYGFRCRSLLVFGQALPLLLPSFLLAIGWSNLASLHVLGLVVTPAGLAATLFATAMQAVPLPLFATWAACRNLSGSQRDSARLHGGERAVLWFSARACAAPAALSALLAGVLSLSDSGVALTFGCRVASVEILTSFSALYDFGLAARQCLVLAALVMLLTVPLLASGLPSIAAAMLARQVRTIAPYRHRWAGRVAITCLAALLAVGLGLPIAGLCFPAVHNPMLGRAAHEVLRTAAPTVVYSGGAGLICLGLAMVVAVAVGNRRRLRLVVLSMLVGLFALPAALPALGVIQMAAQSPAELDWLIRGQVGVAFVLAVRFLPVATVAMMRAVASLSPSWADAACLHGVSASRFLVLVVLPLLAPAALVAMVVVMLLATADVTTVLLLQPPGRASLPVAIFTVMANSPEGLVASLCLLYLAAAVLLLAAATPSARWLARGVA